MAEEEPIVTETEKPASIDDLGANPSDEDLAKFLGVSPEANPAPNAEGDGEGEGEGTGEGEGEGEGSGDGEGEGDEGAGDGLRADGQPIWLPEKFKTPEDMAKAHKSLEKKLGEGGGKPEKKVPGKLSIKPKEGEGDGEGDGEGTPRVLDQDYINELGEEFYANDGKLPKETLERVAKEFNTTPEFVETMMSTQATKNEMENNNLMVDAGIKTGDEWNNIVKWAEKNVPANLAEGLEEMLNSKSLAQRGAAITKLKTLFDGRRGAKKERITGSSDSQSHLKPIRNQTDHDKAMDDERFYADGPEADAYRTQVEQRLVLGGMA